MSPGEAGGCSVCILPQVNGTRSSIDVLGVAAEAVTPGSGKRANFFTGIEAARVTNPGCRDGFGQRKAPNQPLIIALNCGRAVTVASWATRSSKLRLRLRATKNSEWPQSRSTFAANPTALAATAAATMAAIP